MSDLGRFSQRFASWRQILGTVPPDDRPRIFANAAADVAGYLAKGLDRVVAADELTDMAIACGLVDADAVQQTITEASKTATRESRRAMVRHRRSVQSAQGP
jgi:hypothetical protein